MLDLDDLADRTAIPLGKGLLDQLGEGHLRGDRNHGDPVLFPSRFLGEIFLRRLDEDGAGSRFLTIRKV